MRVKIHLLRGSIEQARHAIEDGWQMHLEEIAELPSGLGLKDVSLARVIDDYRIANTLEKHGILTVGNLMAAVSSGKIRLIPNMGPVTVKKLVNLAEDMRDRVGS